MGSPAESAFVGCVLVLMFFCLFIGFKTPETVVFMCLVLVWNAGIITTQEALSGYSNNGMLAVGVLFVVIKGVERSQLADKAARSVFGLKTSFRQGLLRLMSLCFFLSAFLNNTPVVALLIPITRDWARTRGFAPSQLLIPLSYSCIFGGVLTVIGTSTNLVVQGLVEDAGLSALGFFEPGYIGLPLGLLGIVYLLFAAPVLLPAQGGLFRYVRDRADELLTEVKVLKSFRDIGQPVQLVMARLGLPPETLIKVRRRVKRSVLRALTDLEVDAGAPVVGVGPSLTSRSLGSAAAATGMGGDEGGGLGGCRVVEPLSEGHAWADRPRLHTMAGGGGPGGLQCHSRHYYRRRNEALWGVKDDLCPPSPAAPAEATAAAASGPAWHSVSDVEGSSGGSGGGRGHQHGVAGAADLLFHSSRGGLGGSEKTAMAAAAAAAADGGAAAGADETGVEMAGGRGSSSPGAHPGGVLRRRSGRGHERGDSAGGAGGDGGGGGGGGGTHLLVSSSAAPTEHKGEELYATATPTESVGRSGSAPGSPGGGPGGDGGGSTSGSEYGSTHMGAEYVDVYPVLSTEVVQAGDVLFLSCGQGAMVSFSGGAATMEGLKLLDVNALDLPGRGTDFFELVLSNKNHFVGQSVTHHEFAAYYGCSVLAVRRRGKREGQGMPPPTSTANTPRPPPVGYAAAAAAATGFLASAASVVRPAFSAPTPRDSQDTTDATIARLESGGMALPPPPPPGGAAVGDGGVAEASVDADKEGGQGRSRARSETLAREEAAEVRGMEVAKSRFGAGDVVLVLAREDFGDKWGAGGGGDFFLVTNVGSIPLPVRYWDYVPLLFFAIMLAWVTITSVDMVRAAFAVGAILILGGWVDAKRAVGYVNWGLLLLIGSALGLSKGITNSGLAGYVGGAIRDSGMVPEASIFVLYAFTMLCTELITNNAAAALSVPVAISISEELQVDYKPFIVAVMLAASSSFITPIGYQTNTMVWGPGGYTFTDFMKIGTPLSLIYMFIGCLAIPFIWPFDSTA